MPVVFWYKNKKTPHQLKANAEFLSSQAEVPNYLKMMQPVRRPLW